jgi:Flp pilus assembly protein TadD
VVTNPQLPGPTLSRALLGSFRAPLPGESRITSSYYRPLSSLSILLDRHTFGLRPFGFHLHNLLLHVLASVLLALFVYLILDRAFWPALLAGLLFALHPVHTESVAFISDRTDLLMTGLMLASLIAAERHLRRGGTGWLTLTCLFYLLSLLAKETALLLPLVIIPLSALRPGAEPARRRRLIVPLVLCAVAYLVARAVVLSQTPATINVMKFYEYPVMVMNVVGTYARMLVFPFYHRVLLPQSPDVTRLSWLTGLGLLLLVAVIAAFAGRRQGGSGRWSRGRAAYLTGCFILLGALLPVTNVLSLGIAYAAERLAYLPSAGFAIMLAAIAAPLLRRRLLQMAGVAAVVLVAFAFDLEHRLPTWRNQLNLFTAMVQEAPQYPAAHHNLSCALRDAGRLAEAEREARLAVLLQPESPVLHNNLGFIQLELDRLDSAEVHFRKAVELSPQFAQAFFNLGLALHQKPDAAGALVAYQQAIQIAPDMFEARNNLGRLHGLTGRLDSAVVHLKAALHLNPTSSEAHTNLGIAYATLDRPDSALSEFRAALRLNPGSAAIRANLGVLFNRLGMPDSARRYDRP